VWHDIDHEDIVMVWGLGMREEGPGWTCAMISWYWLMVVVTLTLLLMMMAVYVYVWAPSPIRFSQVVVCEVKKGRKKRKMRVGKKKKVKVQVHRHGDVRVCAAIDVNVIAGIMMQVDVNEWVAIGRIGHRDGLIYRLPRYRVEN
jgi:uncharacterized protein (DUF58 family)